MAIASRTAVAGSVGSISSIALTAPTGSTTNDVGFIFVVQQQNVASTYTPVSGWTTLFNANGFYVAYRVRQSGDPTTVTVTSSQANPTNSAWAAFSGCDTSTPIDASGTWIGLMSGLNTFTPTKLIAPSLAPSFAADWLFCIFGNQENGGSAIPLPSGMTSRLSNTFGPDILFATLTLTDGSQTGQKVSTVSVSTTDSHFACSIALKASGATTATQAAAVANIAGIYSVTNGTNPALTVPVSQMGVKANDLLVFIGSCASTISPPSGWTSQGTGLGAQIFTHTYQVGDADPGFSTVANDNAACEFLILRASHGAVAVGVDQISTATTGATSATTPSLTPATATELLLTWIASSSITGGTWSSITNTGLTEYADTTFGPSGRFAWRFNSASPSGAYAATMASNAPVFATTLLFAPGATGGAGASAAPGFVVIMA